MNTPPAAATMTTQGAARRPQPAQPATRHEEPTAAPQAPHQHRHRAAATVGPRRKSRPKWGSARGNAATPLAPERRPVLVRHGCVSLSDPERDDDLMTSLFASELPRTLLARKVTVQKNRTGRTEVGPPWHSVSQLQAQELLTDNRLYEYWYKLGLNWNGTAESLWKASMKLATED